MAENGVPAAGASGASINQRQLSINEQLCKVEKKHAKAYQHINEALSCDEQKRIEEAVDHYARGIAYMNSALAIWKSLCQVYPNEMCNSPLASKMDKMTINLTKAQNRMEELLRNDARPGASPRNMVEPPPSYNAAMAQKNLAASRSNSVPDNMADAKLLLFVENGVQLYFISKDGTVSAPSYPSSLAVYKFADESVCEMTADSPPAFLQIGDWIYPLMPSISPALRAEWGAYIFPDVTATEAGCYVGVIIPDTLEVSKHDKFEEILRTFTKYKEQVPDTEAVEAAQPAPSDTVSTISKGIIIAAGWISWGLTKGAEKTGTFIKYGSAKVRERMEPQKESSKINPHVQKGAEYARTATGGAVKISVYLVDKVGEATSALAKTVAPHVRRTSEALTPESWSRKDPKDGRSTLDKVSEVATASLKGFSTVYLGLEQSAKILAKNVAEQTVVTVQYKYGQEAGQLTGNVVGSATNVLVVAGTAKRLGIKAVAQQVAKESGAETLKTNTSGATPGVKTSPPCEKTGQTSKSSLPNEKKTPHSPDDKKGPPPV